MQQPKPESISLADFLTWEELQAERYEWIDGAVLQLGGVTDEHSAIETNLTTIIRTAVGSEGPCFLRGSDRKLVPHDRDGRALGSFYADAFVSGEPSDRKGSAAHVPLFVLEILSEHGNGESTKKRDAYLASAKLRQYLIVDSTRQYCISYSWSGDELVVREYYRGPVPLSSLGLTSALRIFTRAQPSPPSCARCATIPGSTRTGSGREAVSRLMRYSNANLPAKTLPM